MAEVGEVYRHHGGGTYRVLFIVHDSNNQSHECNEDMVCPQQVIYLSLDSGPHCGQMNARSDSEFGSLVVWPDGKMRSRFVRLSDYQRSMRNLSPGGETP